MYLIDQLVVLDKAAQDNPAADLILGLTSRRHLIACYPEREITDSRKSGAVNRIQGK